MHARRVIDSTGGWPALTPLVLGLSLACVKPSGASAPGVTPARQATSPAQADGGSEPADDSGRSEPDTAAKEREVETQLSEELARSQLRDGCEEYCGTTIDRDALVQRVVLRALSSDSASSELHSVHGSYGERSDEEEERFRSFARGGSATILYAPLHRIHFNPEHVELDGRVGLAIMIDEHNRVVACINSDPKLLPTAVRVDC